MIKINPLSGTRYFTVSRFQKGTCSLVNVERVRLPPCEALYFTVEYTSGGAELSLPLCIVQDRFSYNVTDPESGASVYRLQMGMHPDLSLHRAICSTAFRKRLQNHTLAAIDAIHRRITLPSFVAQLTEKRLAIPPYNGEVLNPYTKSRRRK